MNRKRQPTLIPSKSAFTAAKRTMWRVDPDASQQQPPTPKSGQSDPSLLAEIERLEIKLGLRNPPAQPTIAEMSAVLGFAPAAPATPVAPTDHLTADQRAEIAAKMAQPSYQVRETIPAEAARKASQYAAEFASKPSALVQQLQAIQDDKRFSADHKRDLSKPLLDQLHSQANLVEIESMIDALNVHIELCEAETPLVVMPTAEEAAQIAVVKPAYEARWAAMPTPNLLIEDWQRVVKRGDRIAMQVYAAFGIGEIQKRHNGATPVLARELLERTNAALMSDAQKYAAKQIIALNEAKTKLRGAAAAIRTAAETRLTSDGTLTRRPSAPIGGY